MLTNADSLSNKMTELRHRLDNMEIQPDIIAITEAKPKNARFTFTYADYQLKGYEAFTHNVESSTGRGIIIYVRNTLNTVILNLNSTFSEHLILQIRMAYTGAPTPTKPTMNHWITWYMNSTRSNRYTQIVSWRLQLWINMLGRRNRNLNNWVDFCKYPTRHVHDPACCRTNAREKWTRTQYIGPDNQQRPQYCVWH